MDTNRDGGAEAGLMVGFSEVQNKETESATSGRTERQLERLVLSSSIWMEASTDSDAEDRGDRRPGHEG